MAPEAEINKEQYLRVRNYLFFTKGAYAPVMREEENLLSGGITLHETYIVDSEPLFISWTDKILDPGVGKVNMSQKQADELEKLGIEFKPQTETEGKV